MEFSFVRPYPLMMPCLDDLELLVKIPSTTTSIELGGGIVFSRGKKPEVRLIIKRISLPAVL